MDLKAGVHHKESKTVGPRQQPKNFLKAATQIVRLETARRSRMRAKRRARTRAKARTGMTDSLTMVKDHRASGPTPKESCSCGISRTAT
jgi:hypothetical protein